VHVIGLLGAYRHSFLEAVLQPVLSNFGHKILKVKAALTARSRSLLDNNECLAHKATVDQPAAGLSSKARVLSLGESAASICGSLEAALSESLPRRHSHSGPFWT
jgi:hypothetical protein